MEHFSIPAVVFSRKKQNRFPQRNEPPSAKTKLSCRKTVPAGAEGREKQGFGGPFPLWMESARMQIPFVLLQVIPITRLTRGEGASRTAFRGGRQNVAETGFRLSSCIPLGARGSRISVLLPPRARLRDSCRGCLDVLTGCHLGTYCPPQAFWRLRDRRRPAPPKQAREFPRAVFLPISESLKHTAVPTGFLLSRNPSISDEKTIFRHGRNLPNINGWVTKKRWRADFLVRGMSKSHFFI